MLWKSLTGSRPKAVPLTARLCHSYLPHSLANSLNSFKSVDGGVGKYGILALAVTSDVVQEQRIRGSIRLEKLPLAGKGMFCRTGSIVQRRNRRSF